MKTIKINRNSWHYHIIKTYTDRRPEWIGSICQYNRNVLLGILNIFYIIFFTSLTLVILLSPIFYGILYLIYGMPPGELEGTFVVFGVTGYVMIIGFYIAHLLTERKENKLYEMKENGIEIKDSYIGAAWKSFKDKVCVKIEISD
jgi:hypothetical protein